jgi:predicted deacetylase
VKPAPLVVSVHDVAPSALGPVKEVLADLDAAGVVRRVLKVIPDKDGCEDVRLSADLCTLLAQEAARGSEIVQHGFTHRLRGRPTGRWSDRLRATIFAPANAECLARDRQALLEGILAGRAVLREAGFEVRGFCAPAWLMPSWLGEELRQAGFRFCVEMTAVRDLRTGRRLPLRWDGHVGSAAWQERLTAVGAALHARVCTGPAAARVYFHPQQLRSAAYRRALRLVRTLAATRPVVTFSELLGGD